MPRLWIALVSLLALLTVSFRSALAQYASPGPWLFVSDVHFSPYDDPALVDALTTASASQWHAILARGTRQPSPYGRDTNFALLESALDTMQHVTPNPAVVVIAGDFLAHDFDTTFAKLEPGRPRAAYEAFVDDTFAFLANEFDARFPHAQFVIALGNNDGYCGDYHSTPKSPFLANAARAWAPLVDRNGSAPDFARTFPLGGYYAASLPTAAHGDVVVLNAVFWSSLYANDCGQATDDPARAELDWLRTELGRPEAGYRWLLSHIPPTMDAYYSAKSRKPVPFLHETDVRALVDALAPSASQTRAFLMGHTHHPTFALVGDASAPIAGLVAGSISPLQGNNPSFATLSVDGDSGTIRDETTYALLRSDRDSRWTREFAFDATYGVADLSGASLRSVQRALASDAWAGAAFRSYYTSFSLYGGVDPDVWPWYRCANEYLTSEAYVACAEAR